MGRKFNRWLREAAKRGINVGDINQASAIFTGQTPAPAPIPPPPAPKPIKPPKQALATQAQAGQGVRRSKKRRGRVRASDLRIKRKGTTSYALSPLAIGGSGTGMNLGGY